MEQIETRVDLGEVALSAGLSLPDRAAGLVLFAHGSGSSRHSPRNQHVAQVLNRGGMATLLIDLLTEEEERVDVQTAELRFDIPMLGQRVAGVTDWIGRQPALKDLGLGCFGASTGAAAALVAAAKHPGIVQAVVSRGGRPDLAGSALNRVQAPSLFIVGGRDLEVLDLNRVAISGLPRLTERKLEVIPGATHLFEEPGTLDRVATLARDWFSRHLERPQA